MKKTGKIITGFVVGVLSAAAIICVAVPRVRDSIKDFINKLKHDDGKTDNKSDKEKAQEKAHDDDFYKDLDDDEKKDFDNKLNDIIDSDYYKELDEKGKDELVDKFVESEKVQQELKNDAEDKKPEEIEIPTVPTKEDGATDEEIAEAEKKAEEARQEKAYWETVETVKNSVPSDELNVGARYSNVKVRRINSIFADFGTIYINADIIMDENIDGKIFKSQHNTYLQYVLDSPIESTSYSDILDLIQNNCGSVAVNVTCINKNLESHKEYFNNNKDSISSKLSSYENKGYTLSIQDSWENSDSSMPSYLIKANNGEKEKYFYITYGQTSNKYRTIILDKICPEFWAQLEIERAQTATTSAEAKAQAMIESHSTRDENGKVLGLDWGVIQTQRQEQKAEREARLAMADTSSNLNVLYSDQGLSL